MDCAVAVPNVTHKPFGSIFCLHNNNPKSPNMMVSFQHQLEGVVKNNQNHCNNELPLLKRKRPARISVPTLSENVAINSPKVVRVEEIEVEGDGYGVYCKKGKSRAHLEDRHSALVKDVLGHPKQALFGIFDGHGGAKAAEFAAARLGDNILDQVGRVKEAKSAKLIEEKIRDGYLAADEEFLKGGSNGGVCCVTALIQDGDLMVSNVGDCRAVISRGGIAEALTTDHSPSREDEKNQDPIQGWLCRLLQWCMENTRFSSCIKSNRRPTSQAMGHSRT